MSGDYIDSMKAQLSMAVLRFRHWLWPTILLDLLLLLLALLLPCLGAQVELHRQQ